MDRYSHAILNRLITRPSGGGLEEVQMYLGLVEFTLELREVDCAMLVAFELVRKCPSLIAYVADPLLLTFKAAYDHLYTRVLETITWILIQQDKIHSMIR